MAVQNWVGVNDTEMSTSPLAGTMPGKNNGSFVDLPRTKSKDQI